MYDIDKDRKSIINIWKISFEHRIKNNYDPYFILKNWALNDMFVPQTFINIEAMLSAYYPQYLSKFEKYLSVKLLLK